MSDLLKSLFLLRPDIHFLNHGSFGACPRPVFEVYQGWQRELERQPVEFLGRRADELLAESRYVLAAYLGVDADDLVYCPNPTTAINVVARNLSRPNCSQALRPGDEILTTDHEYGAMDRTWRYICGQTGARYVQRPIPLPVTSHADFVEAFWGGVNARTRVVFISHITSPTALTFPVAEICRRAREAGLLTIVDGAHAPGQVPLDLQGLGADIYTGACHKWLCAPKGTAFLYARRQVQSWLEPPVISWGWEDRPDRFAKPVRSFVKENEWQGTCDIAAYLSVPAAIRFQAEHDWPRVRAECHDLLREARRRIEELTGLPGICPDSPEWYAQMAAFPLYTPERSGAGVPACDAAALQRRLYDEYRVEVPVIEWNGRQLVRVSIQGYNTALDVKALVAALRAILR